MRVLRPGLALFAAAATLAAGCPIQPSAARSMLSSTLTAVVASSGVTLTLAVTNGASIPATLEFSSGQQFDVQVRRPDGTAVWTWSADKLFTAMLTYRTLAPGETATYSAVWSPVTPGTYSAVGTLTSTSHAGEATAAFVVP